MPDPASHSPHSELVSFLPPTVRAALTKQQYHQLATVFSTTDQPLHIGEIVDHLLVGGDHAIPPAELAGDRRHVHSILVNEVLPPLVRAGVLTHNRYDDTIAVTAAGKRILGCRP